VIIKNYMLASDKSTPMKRRESLKMLLASSGALLTLPSWAQNWTLSEVSVHPSSFPAEHQLLLTSVADTIIPAGNSIGALTVGVDKFLIKLIDDCYTPEMQDKIKSTLSALNTQAQTQFKKPFSACDQKEREQLLTVLSSDAATGEIIKVLKSETIRGFTTSREVLVDYYKYKTVPGHYYGCVDVNS
jgi:hypothetical protein